jgi:hypothetical protein
MDHSVDELSPSVAALLGGGSSMATTATATDEATTCTEEESRSEMSGELQTKFLDRIDKIKY